MCLSTIYGQYRTVRTGYEGDFFSLGGAIELFKESQSLSAFERKINSKKYYVNNLDLDYDGRTDYVRVEHYDQDDFHAIVLQVAIDRYEVQDVAVIEIEKVGRRDVVLQIVGDEDLYGEPSIVEPVAYSGRGYSNSRRISGSYVNVYYWPIIQRIFAPRYKRYVSPYTWSYYPSWWISWHPFSWNVYHVRVRPYYQYCRAVTIYRAPRAPRAHKYYRPRRVYSRNVAHHTAKVRRDYGKSRGSRGSVNRQNGVRQNTGNGVMGTSGSKIRRKTRRVDDGTPKRAAVSKRVPSSRQIHSSPRPTVKRVAPQSQQAARSADRSGKKKTVTPRSTPKRSPRSNYRQPTKPTKSPDHISKSRSSETTNNAARHRARATKATSSQRPNPARQVGRRSGQSKAQSSVRRSAPARSTSRKTHVPGRKASNAKKTSPRKDSLR